MKSIRTSTVGGAQRQRLVSASSRGVGRKACGSGVRSRHSRAPPAAMTSEACAGCGVQLPPFDGPVHRYMVSSPSCWQVFGQVLTREYGDAAFMASHRLTVDAYAVQHPGDPSPQSIQSVAVHLISLYAMLELQFSFAAATQLMRQSADRRRFDWLEPPPQRGERTVASVLTARTPGQHARAVRRWAQSA